MAEGHRQRLINKCLKNGCDDLSNHEVIELLFFFLLRRVDTNPIAHDLINKYGSFYNICNAPISELMEIDNVGTNSAQFLSLFPKLCRAYLLSAYDEKHLFETTQQLGEYCINLMVGRVNEAIYIICLDSKKRLVKTVKVTEGTPGDVYIEPRQIVEQITHTKTTSLVLCHNHPGGTLFPSQNDIETTAKIKKALSSIGVTLLDHIIVADDNYISFENENLNF